MIQIDNVIVSLDVLKAKFCCDLEMCHGYCCVEGDAGAPVEEGEVVELEKALPIVWEDLSVKARTVINKQGVVYRDSDGDLVTSIVEGKDCVFTCYDATGCCFCALEKAFRAGHLKFYKPISCHLYPIRMSNIGSCKALNYHRWDVCKAAVVLGESKDIPLYKFLREPLVRKFGEKWYTELEETIKELKRQNYI
ncbi:MAG: DUF3109 family protein [Bacteroidaceae bacterium]